MLIVPFSPYNIVALNPKEYSVVYSCTNYFGAAFKLEDLWILTRKAIATDTEEWSSLFKKLSPIISEILPFFD